MRRLVLAVLPARLISSRGLPSLSSAKLTHLESFFFFPFVASTTSGVASGSGEAELELAREGEGEALEEEDELATGLGGATGAARFFEDFLVESFAISSTRTRS